MPNSATPADCFRMEQTPSPTSELGLRVKRLQVRELADAQSLIKSGIAAHADAFVTGGGFLINNQPGIIVNALAQARMPGLFINAEFGNAGGLLSYGANTHANF